MEETNVLEEMDEAVETDIIKKEYKDLTDSEKARIVRELQVYSLSDSWNDMQAILNAEAEEIEKQINSLLDGKRDKELKYSQCDRDNETSRYMEYTVSNIDDSFGGKIFKNKLANGAKNYAKSIKEKLEPGYDADCYTELDMLKNDRLLRLSVKVWLQQTINAYEKPVEAPEVSSAY